jgi:ribosome-binding factor A
MLFPVSLGKAGNGTHYSENLNLVLPSRDRQFLSTDAIPTRFLSQLKSRSPPNDHRERSIRQLRVANSVHQALLECIFVEDLLFGNLDRTRLDLRRVEMSPDLRYAKVYWQSNDGLSNTKVSLSLLEKTDSIVSRSLHLDLINSPTVLIGFVSILGYYRIRLETIWKVY